MPLTLHDWFESGHNRALPSAFSILQDITVKLNDAFHKIGKVHGSLTPHCIVIDRAGDHLLSIEQEQPEDAFNRWLPVDEPPSRSLDVFSLGCLYYYVLSNGRHPFGDSVDKKTLTQLNLCLLDHQLDYFRFYELVVVKMLHKNAEKRAQLEDIVQLPMFFHHRQLENHLVGYCRSIGEQSEVFRFYDRTLVHRDGSISYGSETEDTDERSPTFSYKISTIIHKIRGNELTLIQHEELFRKLAFFIWSCENGHLVKKQQPVTSADNRLLLNGLPLVVSSSRIEDDEKKKPFLPERYHGRFLDRYVNVIAFDDVIDFSKIEEKIQNDTLHSWLKIRKSFHDKTSSKWYLAVDPFDETLETWVYSNNKKFSSKEAVWLMMSVASNITKDLPHDYITPGHIILNVDGTIKDMRLAFLPFKTRLHAAEDLYYETWSHKNKRIAALSEVFSFILEHTDNFNHAQLSSHLISAMRKEKSAVKLANLKEHPLLWTDDKYFKFIQETEEFYESHPYFGLNCIQSNEHKLKNLKLALKGRKLNTYRDLIKCLSVLITEAPQLAANVLECYKDTLLRIWIKMNRFKSTCCEEFKQLPEAHEDSGIAIDEDVHFVPKSPGGFIVYHPNSSILREEPLRIKRFIADYIKQYKEAQADYAAEDPNQTLKHPDINQKGGNVLHLASHSNEFHQFVDELVDIGLEINETDDNGMTPLHFAALTNSNVTAETLVRKGANVELKDKLGRTPMFFAIAPNKSVEMAKLLRHSDYVIDEVNALEMSVTANSFEIADYLIPGENIETLNKALQLSVALKRRDFVDLLLSYDAKPSGVIHSAVINQSTDIVELLIALNGDLNEKDSAGQTPLHLIASSEAPNLKMAELLLDNGAKVDSIDDDGCSPLHKAVLVGNIGFVSLLIARGCNVNAKFKGLTPLHIAAQFNRYEIAKLLIDNQALVEILDEEGDTPLEYAAWADSFEVCELIVESGALVSAPRSKSRSSLHVACALDSIKVADYLIELGADVSAKDQLGLTPVHYAQLMNNKKIIGLFEQLETKHLSVEEPIERAVELKFEQLSVLMKQFIFKRVKKVAAEAFAWPATCTFEGKSRKCGEFTLPKCSQVLNKLMTDLKRLKEKEENLLESEQFNHLLMVPRCIDYTADGAPFEGGFDFYE